MSKDPRRFATDTDDLDCPICLEPFCEPTHAEPCGHVACRDCLNRVVECPTCRAHVLSTTPCDEAFTFKAHSTQVGCLNCPWTGTRNEQITQAHVMCPVDCMKQADEKIAAHGRIRKDAVLNNQLYLRQMMKKYCPNILVVPAHIQMRIITHWSTLRHSAIQSLSGPASCLLWTLLDACSTSNSELAIGLALRALAIPPTSLDAFPDGLDWQYCCLMLAAGSNHATLRELLRNGFTVPSILLDSEYKYFRLMMECPIKFGDYECLRLLIQNCSFVHFGESCFTSEVLSLACDQGRTQWMQRLVEAGASVNKPFVNRRGESTYPLFRAVKVDNADLVSELLRLGANLDHRNCRVGRTALHAAMFNKSTECLRILLKAGANTEVRDKYGSTPIILAATLSKLDHIASLLAAGADLNVIRPFLDTLLRHASRCGNLTMIKYLHELIKPHTGKRFLSRNAITFALKSQNISVDVLSYLIEKGYRVSFHALSLAIEKKSCWALEMLLVHVCDPNNTHQFSRLDGSNAMLLAVKSDDVDVIKLLFDYGADLSPEQDAIIAGHLDSVFYLHALRENRKRSSTT